jgi:hypothetical protein
MARLSVLAFHYFNKMPEKTTQRREEGFILLVVSEVSIRHSGEGTAEKLTSWWPGSHKGSLSYPKLQVGPPLKLILSGKTLPDIANPS